jgi:hypothetical protein
MRVLVPLLFVMVAVYWLLQLLHFVFVTNFENVVASVVIVFIVFVLFRGCFALQKYFRS